MKERSYSHRTVKLLFGRSARCAFPGCTNPLTDCPRGADVVVAEIAHICGLKPGSERYDASMTDEQRNAYENLILLCGTHHGSYVDGALGKYTAAELRQWKADEERRVEEWLRSEMPRVTFAELEVVMKAMLGQPGAPATDLTLIPPAQKMAKNALTARSGVLMGLTKVAEVRDLLQRHAAIDSAFPERLRAGFVAQYTLLHAEGDSGDVLFIGLREFAAGGSRDPRMLDAALAVLTYLFEACEVFER